MAETSEISWTDATFNPWIGCAKVSEGCRHCYAEADFDHRKERVKWGPQGTRSRTSVGYWRGPLKWNREAEAEGVRRRVFCCSLADVFEGPETLPADAIEMVTEARKDLGELILKTPNLDWLLLTKRPQNVMEFVRDMWLRFDNTAPLPPNVWIGTSIENQAAADERIPHLLQVPAKVRFLSMEPLLGPVDLTRIPEEPGYVLDALQGKVRGTITRDMMLAVGKINWVIVGGESGPEARPMNPDWARSLRDQCQDAGVSFHFKQFGEYAPQSAGGMFSVGDKLYHTVDELGRLDVHNGGGQLQMIRRVGKKNAGRLLDGRTWDEFPVQS